MSGIRISEITLDAPDGHEHESVRVCAVGRIGDDYRFDPRADVWAVRKGGWCLSNTGEWEREPLPSSRDDEFLASHRWPLIEALQRAAEALERDNVSRVVGR